MSGIHTNFTCFTRHFYFNYIYHTLSSIDFPIKFITSIRDKKIMEDKEKYLVNSPQNVLMHDLTLICLLSVGRVGILETAHRAFC